MVLGGCEQCPRGQTGPLCCTSRAPRVPEDFTEGPQGREPASLHFQMPREGAGPTSRGPASNGQAEGAHHTPGSQETGQLGQRVAVVPRWTHPGNVGELWRPKCQC